MKVGIMASGRGSNFQALIDASQNGEMPDVELSVLVVNKKNAYAIQRAEKNNIECLVITSDDRTRNEFDQTVLKIMKERQIEIIVLAGFMRLLTPRFIEAYRNKILNIHPSLLLKYKELDIHKRVLKNKEKFSGCTVHYVTPKLDSEKIILQKIIK